MRHIKRIGLFFYSCALLAAGAYGYGKYLDFFYPGLWYAAPEVFAGGRDARGEAASGGALAGGAPADGSLPDVTAQGTEAEALLPVSGGEQKITANTVLVLRIRDLDLGTERVEELRMPEKYIGMDREQFLHYMQDGQEDMTLREREAGLSFREVESFSADRVVVTKGYRQETASAQESYRLLLIGNRVVICGEDGSVLQRTDIDGRTLPWEVRSEILNGDKKVSRKELEIFLVTYAAS